MIAISLGGGVQSTALCLMAAAGEIAPMPDLAIFADTGWESKSTINHVLWLAGVLPFPIVMVRQGILREELLNSESKFDSIPSYRKGGQVGRRQCTYQYKIRPIRAAIRAEMQRRRDKAAELWIGISRDEVARMKAADVQYLTHRWPLVDMDMTRASCIEWLEAHGFPVPSKSSCVGCPFKADRQWAEMKRLHPTDFANAVEVDHALNLKQQYLHRSCRPLDEVTFRGEGQELMLEECTGFCGI